MKKTTLKKSIGISIIESMIGISLGIVCVSMMLKIFSESLLHNESVKEESIFTNPIEFQRQVRDELEGSGFDLTINSTSNPKLFMCNMVFNKGKKLECKSPKPSDNNFCIVSSKQRAEVGSINPNVIITGFRRKPGSSNVLEKFKQSVPETSALAKKPEKQICEDSEFWNELHQSKSMSVTAFKVCLANIASVADLGLSKSPPNACNLGSIKGVNSGYNIISNSNPFIWFYINTTFHNNKNAVLPLKFLVHIRNQPDIVIP